MSRKALLLLMGALAPALGACASSQPEPVMMMARTDAAVPPMPAELLAATNGKADSPLQVETLLVLAAQEQREATAPRGVQLLAPAAPAPVRVARAPAPPAFIAPPRVAPVTFTGDRKASAQAPDSIEVASLTRGGHAERVSADPATSPPTPLAPPRLARAPRRNTVRASRLVQVAHASEGPSRPAATITLARLPSAPRAHGAQLHRGRGVHPSAPPPSILVRIRTLVAGWLSVVRV